MPQINFNVPEDKLPRIVAAMIGLYPTPVDEEGEPLFTPAQWAKEAVRRMVIREVRNWERRKASIDASEAITVDNDLLS